MKLLKAILNGFIFTLVWAFNHKEDEEYVDQIIDIFKKEKHNVHLVELNCDLSERLTRNKHPNRLKHKPSKRDIEASEKRLLHHNSIYRLTSNEGEFSDKSILKINNTHLSPIEVSERIIAHYTLKTKA